MIVCLCEGVTDNTVRRAIHSGCSSVSDVAKQTRAGTGCGACGCDLKRLLLEARGSEDDAATSMVAAQVPLAAK